jgi:hypothetical protein
MFGHSGSMWRIACEARDRAIAVTRANAAAWPSDAIVAILLGAASAEAFINELAEMLLIHKNAAKLPELPPQLRACADALTEIEDARGSLNLKYLVASQTLSGSMFDKGSNPYQDFATLVKLRNDLIHLRPQDIFLDVSPPATIQVPKYVEALQQRGLARSPPSGTMMSWFNRLQTAEMATWACATAHAIILAVLALTPDDPHADPLAMFKMVFRTNGS